MVLFSTGRVTLMLGERFETPTEIRGFFYVTVTKANQRGTNHFFDFSKDQLKHAKHAACVAS